MTRITDANDDCRLMQPDPVSDGSNYQIQQITCDGHAEIVATATTLQITCNGKPLP